MQIILVSRHLKTAKTLNIMPQHVLLAALVFVVVVLITSATFSWLSLELRLPVVQDILTSLQRKESQKTQEVMSNNLQLMATRLGELQAQVLQLDSLGDRLSNIAGVARDNGGDKGKQATKPPGQGGPFVAPRLSYGELQQEIDRLASIVEYRSDELTMLESKLLEKRVQERLLPTTHPVKGASVGSGFGPRSDPIARVRAMHEGLDFHAEMGTPVVAAAAGVVLKAEYHPEFGNVIDVDHGEGLVSRYAHLSRMDVRAGRIVRRGEAIGLVGSTGRSTGPHLHFEVRMLGAPQNPMVFLNKERNYAQLGKR